MKKLAKSLSLIFFLSFTLLFLSCGGDGGGDGDGVCIDNDGDGYGRNCDKGPDCDDNDPNNWFKCITCRDNDGDDFYAACDRYKTIKGPDCDDADANVFPGAREICDGVDNQCPEDAGYGYVDEGCAGGDQWPEFAGSYTAVNPATAVFVRDEYAYLMVLFFDLYVIDVSSPDSCTVEGSYGYPGETQTFFIDLSGNYAYVPVNDMSDVDNSGLLIIDISDPSSPSLAGKYHMDFPRGVYYKGGYAYVTDLISGLQIIDVSNPDSCTLAGSYGPLNQPLGVYVKGDYAYVADRDGLKIIDVSNPDSTSLVGSYEDTEWACSVLVRGKLCICSDC